MNQRIWLIVKYLWLAAVITYFIFRIATATRASDPGAYVAAALVGGAVLLILESRYRSKTPPA